MKLFILALCAVLFLGCSNSEDDKVDLEIGYRLDQGRTCKTYLADHFLVSVYDSEQRKITEKEIPCEKKDNDEKMILSVEKDSYFISVVLRDSDEDWRSYGAIKTDVLDDSKVVIDMKPYIGGLIFEWDTDNCDSYDLAIMSFGLSAGEKPVSAVIWGEDTEIKDYQVPCVAGRFEVINIPPEPADSNYSAKINTFRTPLAFTQSRISYKIPDFLSGQGKNIKIDLDDAAKVDKKILVSDMKVQWEFDSRSIESCDDAKVTKVKAELVSDSYTISYEQKCDDEFSDFYLYDIIQKSYTLRLYGYSAENETLFEASRELGEIKPGSIGKEILKPEIIRLKEK